MTRAAPARPMGLAWPGIMGQWLLADTVPIGAVLAGALLLAACNGDDASQQPGVGGAPDAQGETIACGTPGDEGLVSRCIVERARRDGTLFLVVWGPDGGFRRFEVLSDGRGMAVADGADEAHTAVVDGMLEVTVAQDRYRFPVTIQDNDNSD